MLFANTAYLDTGVILDTREHGQSKRTVTDSDVIIIFCLQNAWKARVTNTAREQVADLVADWFPICCRQPGCRPVQAIFRYAIQLASWSQTCSQSGRELDSAMEFDVDR